MLNQGFNPSDSPSPYGEITSEQIYNNKTPVSQDIRRSYIPDDYAIEANKLIAKKSSKHIRPLCSTFILVIGLAIILGLYFSDILLV